MDAAFIARNWVPDINRFGLPKPPDWFLKAMWDLDAMLLVMPSRQRQCYLLARKFDKCLRVPAINQAHKRLMRETRGSDGDLLADNNCQCVDTINGNPHHDRWTPMILQELRERDTWNAGGGEKYADKLEAEEKAAADKVRANWTNDMEYRAKDAYRSYQARTGQRNQHANAGHKKSAKVTRPVNMPSNGQRPAGSGIEIVSGFTR